jgi:hypothetical protein
MDDGHDPAEDHWWYDDDDDYPGEAATIAAADVEDNFIDMFGNFTYVRATVLSIFILCSTIG